METTVEFLILFFLLGVSPSLGELNRIEASRTSGIQTQVTQVPTTIDAKICTNGNCSVARCFGFTDNPFFHPNLNSRQKFFEAATSLKSFDPGDSNRAALCDIKACEMDCKGSQSSFCFLKNFCCCINSAAKIDNISSVVLFLVSFVYIRFIL